MSVRSVLNEVTSCMYDQYMAARKGRLSAYLRIILCLHNRRFSCHCWCFFSTVACFARRSSGSHGLLGGGGRGRRHDVVP